MPKLAPCKALWPLSNIYFGWLGQPACHIGEVMAEYCMAEIVFIRVCGIQIQTMEVDAPAPSSVGLDGGNGTKWDRTVR